MKQGTPTKHVRGEGLVHRSARGLALLTGVLLFAALLAVGCSRSDDSKEPASPGGKRSSEAGSVTVEFSWDGPDSGLAFKVAMDTHEVDLDGFDLMKLAVLRTDTGVEVAPTGWDAQKGGHHREGKLSFPASVDGRPILGETVRGMIIIVRDVASPERSFEWNW